MPTPTCPHRDPSSQREGWKGIHSHVLQRRSVRTKTVQSQWAGLLVCRQTRKETERFHGSRRKRKLFSSRRLVFENNLFLKSETKVSLARPETVGRSLNKNGEECEQMECAQICEYGFKLDEDGCHTCKCDDPCDGYMCPEDEECVNVKESSCTDFLCPSLPVCKFV